MLLTRPRLFALGVFPGVFTSAASGGLVYFLWDHWLRGRSLWLVVPALFISMFVAWLSLGKLALLPVEDLIINECQRELWGEVRLPATRLTLRRLVRETLTSALLAIGALGILILSFIPELAPLEFVFAAWTAAYSFLSTIYIRREARVRGRLALFFRHPIEHFLLGLLLNALLFVPILNVLVLGYAQVLACLVYFQSD
jgi:uncharacterized protein involved in cysteine biosynthesis